MDFKKDLLLIDLETTGLDVRRHEIIQIAAVLLDKKTLVEKDFFNAYVRPAKWGQRDRGSMAINKIKKEWLVSAPPLRLALKAFNEKFKPREVILSHYGGLLDMDFLRAAFLRVGLKWRFDYHFFNLWAAFYGFLAARGALKNTKKFTGFGLEDLMHRFKIKSASRHDALEDCRIEAEILRKIVEKL